MTFFSSSIYWRVVFFPSPIRPCRWRYSVSVSFGSTDRVTKLFGKQLLSVSYLRNATPLSSRTALNKIYNLIQFIIYHRLLYCKFAISAFHTPFYDLPPSTKRFSLTPIHCIHRSANYSHRNCCSHWIYTMKMVIISLCCDFVCTFGAVVGNDASTTKKVRRT